MHRYIAVIAWFVRLYEEIALASALVGSVQYTCPVALLCIVTLLCPIMSGSVYFCVLKLSDVGVST